MIEIYNGNKQVYIVDKVNEKLIPMMTWLSLCEDVREVIVSDNYPYESKCSYMGTMRMQDDSLFITESVVDSFGKALGIRFKFADYKDAMSFMKVLLEHADSVATRKEKVVYVIKEAEDKSIVFSKHTEYLGEVPSFKNIKCTFQIGKQ